MRRTARRYVDNTPRRVEGMTRDEICVQFQDRLRVIAWSIYRRQRGDTSLTAEDLASCGALGLLEAFERFDESKGLSFSTFAEYRIRGAMYDALRGEDTFSRRRRQLSRRLADAARTVRNRAGREAQPEEVAAQLGMSLEEYWAAVDKTKPVNVVSLDTPARDDEQQLPLIERVMDDAAEAPDAKLYVQQVRKHLRDAIAELPERQCQCVLMYYGKDMSLAEIAPVYGVTVSRISQILSEARRRLRKKLMNSIQPDELEMAL